MGKPCHGNVTTVPDPSWQAEADGPNEPEILQFVKESEAFFADCGGLEDIAGMRRCYDNLCEHFHRGRPACVEVTDAGGPGPGGEVPVRIYRPAGGGNGGGLIYIHGGGFVLGSLDTHDDACCGLAEQAGATVIALDYRLAPEHRFPAAYEDCAAASQHILDNARGFDLNPERIAIGGDSAGGNLAAAVCLGARDSGGQQPCGQVLIYPAVTADMSSGSYISRANAPGLTTEDMHVYMRMYLGDDVAGAAHKFNAPLLETDFGALPPAFLVACEWDPLRDDAQHYADRLNGAGIAATVRLEAKLVHGALRARHTSPAARAMFEAIADAVQGFTQ